jgi:hypothetical protein
MSAKTKAYTETQIVAGTKVLGHLDDMVRTLEVTIHSGPEEWKQNAREQLEFYKLARKPVANALAKTQAAKQEAQG